MEEEHWTTNDAVNEQVIVERKIEKEQTGNMIFGQRNTILKIVDRTTKIQLEIRKTHNASCKELLFAGAEDGASTGYTKILADARVVPAIDQAAIVARQKDKIVGGFGARETEIG